MAGCDQPVSRATAENEPKRSTFHKVTRICGFRVFALNPAVFAVTLTSVLVLAASCALLSADTFIWCSAQLSRNAGMSSAAA